jgi:hypothetical protein
MGRETDVAREQGWGQLARLSDTAFHLRRERRSRLRNRSLVLAVVTAALIVVASS